MLIEDGYAHSLKALLEKNREEEAPTAARAGQADLFEEGYRARVMRWFAAVGAWFTDTGDGEVADR